MLSASRDNASSRLRGKCRSTPMLSDMTMLRVCEMISCFSRLLFRFLQYILHTQALSVL
jgi:hypothetical protein